MGALCFIAAPPVASRSNRRATPEPGVREFVVEPRRAGHTIAEVMD
jgi:hypothetical protein